VSQGNKDLTVALALAASNQMSSLTALTVNSVLSTPRCQMKKFIETNQSRLSRSYSEITTFFRRHSIRYFPCNAGLYVWARLGGDTIQTPEEENALWEKLNEHGVGVSAGSGYHANEAGWFRITFAVPENILSDALRKIELALGLRPPSSYSSEFVDLESGKEIVVRSPDQQGMLGLLRKAGDVLLTRVKGYLGYKPWSLAT
jgi:gliotoxin/aspirochlorine biosynthesis aminotransferase